MSLSVDGTWKSGVWATTVWADGVWFEGAASLIGRKYPRHRGRSRPRYEEIVKRIKDGEVDAVAKEYAQAVILQAQEIASARTDLEIAKRMMKRGKDKMERLAILEARVFKAEERMVELSDEEELILILAIAI